MFTDGIDTTMTSDDIIYDEGIATCGNGTVENPETCDDNNTDNGDGCDSTCQWETRS